MEFGKPSIIAKESSRRVRIPVNRINGADGHVSVAWKTRDITAISGKDYQGGEGVLKFDHGETCRTIDIEIFDSMVLTLCLMILIANTENWKYMYRLTEKLNVAIYYLYSLVNICVHYQS